MSRIDSEEFNKLAEKTKAELREIWNKIGLSTGEMSKEEDQFFVDLRSVFGTRVQKEKQVQLDMEREIAETAEKIVQIRDQLEVPEPYVGASGSLRERQAQVRKDFGTHEARRQHQVAVIEANLTSLRELAQKLGEELKEEHKAVGSNITNARLAGIKTDVAALAETVTVRRARVAELSKVLAERADDMKLAEESESEDKEAAVGARITAAGLVGADVALTLTLTSLTPLDKQAVAGQLDEIGVHKETLAALEARFTHLSAMHAERNKKLQEFAHSITHLWRRLAEPAPDQQAWIRKHRGLSVNSLRSCQVELIRLLHKKSQCLGELIAKARVSLVELWDQMQVGAEERAAFADFASAEVSDAVLEEHERMIKRMTLRNEAMRPLLLLVAKRAQLKEEEAEFKRSQLDPNRFKIAGRLIQEEKTRKRLEKQLPKADAELRQGIPAWEEQYGEFRVAGARYLEVMDDENAAEASRRDEEKSAKEREKFLRRAAAAGGSSAPAAPAAASASSRLSVRPLSASSKLNAGAK